MNTSSFISSDTGGGGNKKRKVITPPISAAPIIAAKKPATALTTTATAVAVSGCVTTTLDSSNNPNNNDKKKNNPPSSSVEIVDLHDFLKALPKTKLTLRAKTHVQLEIIDITTTTATATAAKKKKKMKSASASTSSSCHVVISGAMDLKNLNQLIAYLTGHTQDYNYHSQKGKVLKGSFFLLNHPPHPNDNNNDNNDDDNNNNTLTIGEKSLAKSTVGAAGRHHVDKDIKITQIFQGLITGPTSGIVYDSDIAKNIQLTWKSNKHGPTYKIVCTGILANKCLLGKQEPLPRVVNNVIGNGSNTISKGFMNGQFLYRTNDVIRGDRKSPPKLSFGSGNKKNPRQRTNENAAKPIAAFEQTNIESAGLPTSSLVSSTTF
ncbi:hypothetical protein FRACYDRAFT_250596 [Fragilariopsis cylindrus CCMP1102]|uniref:Uncharacterized protein n=1 Tax=Fragilariopsis cylindrus CCMP1102 TaxID=635003 RepID=A0A1E7EQ04_9STRA|nr:hypothetical protein FRACYDRAFT_250596 [Fragilariopsis cylindrus CCMP1102]|eukprot:OEU07945.1 hypothetical protein FRACYDRAFT_250596 [Fragilariopsis cylindrus CCMP1102]